MKRIVYAMTMACSENAVEFGVLRYGSHLFLCQSKLIELGILSCTKLHHFN